MGFLTQSRNERIKISSQKVPALCFPASGGSPRRQRKALISQSENLTFKIQTFNIQSSIKKILNLKS